VNKTEASATQFAKCIMLHVYSRKTAVLQLHKHKHNSHVDCSLSSNRKNKEHLTRYSEVVIQ